MSDASTFVSVVLPLCDDGDVLEGLVDELAGLLEANWQNWELVLVDDASSDATRAVVTRLLARREGLRYVRLSRRSGPEVALLAGLDHVIGDIVVVLQAESDPPALLPRFVAAARDGGGVVFGVASAVPRQGFAYRQARRIFARGLAPLLDLDVPEGATLYMAFTRQALNAVLTIKDRSRALRVFGAAVGFPRQHLDYTPVLRRASVRAKPLREAIERGLSLVVTNSTRPLRWVALLGLVASGLCLTYIVYVGLVAIFKSHVAEGWITISLVFASLSFLLFLILAVLCEYVGRLLAETRERPLYFVAEESTSSVVIADAERRNVVHESA